MAKLQLLSENDFDENKKYILLMVLVMFDPGGILWTHKWILVQCVYCVSTTLLMVKIRQLLYSDAFACLGIIGTIPKGKQLYLLKSTFSFVKTLFWGALLLFLKFLYFLLHLTLSYGRTGVNVHVINGVVVAGSPVTAIHKTGSWLSLAACGANSKTAFEDW